MSFNNLNMNMIAIILSKVSPTAFISVLGLSHQYQNLKQNKYFWKTILDSEFPGVVDQTLDRLDAYKSKYTNLKFEKLTTQYPKKFDETSDPKYRYFDNQIKNTQDEIKVLNAQLTELYKSRDEVSNKYRNKIKTSNRAANGFKRILETGCEKCKLFPLVSVALDDARMMGFETNIMAIRLFKSGTLRANELAGENFSYIIKTLTQEDYNFTDRTVLLIFLGQLHHIKENQKPKYIFYFTWNRDQLTVLEFPIEKLHNFNELLKSENPEYTLATIYARYGFNFSHR
jgi:hypothetical protein